MATIAARTTGTATHGESSARNCSARAAGAELVCSSGRLTVGFDSGFLVGVDSNSTVGATVAIAGAVAGRVALREKNWVLVAIDVAVCSGTVDGVVCSGTEDGVVCARKFFR